MGKLAKTVRINQMYKVPQLDQLVETIKLAKIYLKVYLNEMQRLTKLS